MRMDNNEKRIKNLEYEVEEINEYIRVLRDAAINQPLDEGDYECIYRCLNYFDEKRTGNESIKDPCEDCPRYCKRYTNLVSPVGPIIKVNHLAYGHIPHKIDKKNDYYISGDKLQLLNDEALNELEKMIKKIKECE